MHRIAIDRRWAAWEVGLLAIGTLLAIVTVSACQVDTGVAGPDVTINRSVQARDCTVDAVNLPGVKGRFDFDLPSKCPLQTLGPRPLFFNAVMTLNYHGSAPSGYNPIQNSLLSTDVRDQGNQSAYPAVHAQWQDFYVSGANEDTLAFVYLNGSYNAGDSVTNCPSRSCEDRLEVFVPRSTYSAGGNMATVVAHVPYIYGANYLRIENSPGTSVDPGQAFTLSAGVHTAWLTPPVSYAWTRDGQTVSTDTTYSDAASSTPNTPTQIGLTASDANGNQFTDGITIRSSAGCGTGLVCGARAPVRGIARDAAGRKHAGLGPAPALQHR